MGVMFLGGKFVGGVLSAMGGANDGVGVATTPADLTNKSVIFYHPNNNFLCTCRFRNYFDGYVVLSAGSLG